MGLEVAGFISQLDANNPVGGVDNYSTADDHLRLVKSVLRAQFPNFTAAAMTATVANLNTVTGTVELQSNKNANNGYAGLDASAQLADARVKASNVTQHQASLALAGSQLTSGTIPDARFPATLPAASGVNLTALNASNLGSGTVPDARFPATLPAISGANLTNLDAADLATGTIPNGRFPATLPAASGANLTALNASELSTGTIPNGRFPATLPAANGSNLTSLTAGNLSGTVPNGNLPNIGSMPGITIQSDPGGTPSGSAGQMFFYY